MFNTAHIQQIPADRAATYVLRIGHGVTSEEMVDLAVYLDLALDRHDKIDMLLFLHDFTLWDAVQSLSLRAMATQAQSLAHVNRYAVVGAPALAALMIEVFDTVIPVEARSFDAKDADAAWTFINARPLGQPVPG
ncbi:MAG: STAS/SEC14 domain-containing protein [Rhodobacteraceae bacterium PARR1]|nr:MAG: STAS/SEC14 domain-containing protein [Rhodobacteraceae bacterium PARR1]